MADWMMEALTMMFVGAVLFGGVSGSVKSVGAICFWSDDMREKILSFVKEEEK